MLFHVESMTCGGCARSVTRAIQSVDPAAEVSADPPRRRVEVKTGAPRERIEAALREAGFEPDVVPS
ncbi:heavy-metal-associated domain-containing protein [Dokdonella sp.]|uniref:heavy-metal-associated domain-containing protein n=1 Tax=Dokdonella sp. TaxID=2291710 RepID=UPI00261748A5|nr:heavy-metal-associated domain-containing protein [Dokdonella sp.]